MKHILPMIGAGLMLAVPPAAAQLQMPAQSKNAVSIKERMAEMRQYAVKKAPATRADHAAPVTEADGEVKNYVKTYDGCFVYMDMEYVNGQEVDASIVWGEGNEVYFPDIISMCPTGGFAKGVLVGDKIMMTLPQTVAYEEYEYDGELVQSYVLLSLLAAENYGDMVMYEPTEGNSEITFTVGEDGTVTMDALEDGYALGLVGDDNIGNGQYWMGFAEFAMSFAPSNGAAFDPSTFENTPYSYFTRGYDTPVTPEPEFGHKVYVAYDGDDVYFTGISIDEPRWWVKGHREGNKVILDNNQKMGTLANTYTVSLMFGKRDPEAYGGFSLLPADTQFVFNYDEEKNEFTTDTPEVVMFINALPDQIYYLTMLEDPTFIYQPNAAGNPRDPWSLEFNAAIYDKLGYGTLGVNLPIVSTDGVLLDRNNMYYQIYIDGELMDLDSAEYGLPEDTTDIPYNFDEEAIVCNRINSYHEMIFHIDGFDKIGVKLFNVYDGVTYESNLVELEVEPGGITSRVEGVTAGANVVGEEFYDMTGRRVCTPQNGIFIKRAVLDDGTVKVTKEVK